MKDDKIMLEFNVDASVQFKGPLNIEHTESTHSYRVIMKRIENVMAIHSPPFELLGVGFCLTGCSKNSKIGMCLKHLGGSEKHSIYDHAGIMVDIVSIRFPTSKNPDIHIEHYKGQNHRFLNTDRYLKAKRAEENEKNMGILKKKVRSIKSAGRRLINKVRKTLNF